MVECVSIAEATINSIPDFFVYPSICDGYFYIKIIGFLYLITIAILFLAEEKKKFQSDMISTMAVAAIAYFILGVIGTLVTSSTGIPMIGVTQLLYLLAPTIILVMIWFFKPKE